MAAADVVRVLHVDLGSNTVEVLLKDDKRVSRSFEDVVKASWRHIELFQVFEHMRKTRRQAFGDAPLVSADKLAFRYESHMHNVLEEHGHAIFAWELAERFATPRVYIGPEVMTQMLQRTFMQCDLLSDDDVYQAFTVLRRLQQVQHGCKTNHFVPAVKALFEKQGWCTLAEILEASLVDITLNPSPRKNVDERTTMSMRPSVPRSRRQLAKRLLLRFLVSLFEDDMCDNSSRLSESLLASILVSRGDDMTAISDLVPRLLQSMVLENETHYVEAAGQLLCLMWHLQCASAISASRSLSETIHNNFRIFKWENPQRICVISSFSSPSLRFAVAERCIRFDAVQPPGRPTASPLPSLDNFVRYYLLTTPSSKSFSAAVDHIELVNVALEAYVNTRVLLPLPDPRDRELLDQLGSAVTRASEDAAKAAADRGSQSDKDRLAVIVESIIKFTREFIRGSPQVQRVGKSHHRAAEPAPKRAAAPSTSSSAPKKARASANPMEVINLDD